MQLQLTTTGRGELQTYDYRPGAVGGSADGYGLKQNALNSPRGNHHS